LMSRFTRGFDSPRPKSGGILVFSLLAGIFLCAAPVLSQVYETLPVISGVELTVDGRPGEATMRSLVPLEEGEVFSLIKVTESIRQLYRTGLFSDVRVFREGDQRVKLTFILSSKLYVRRIHVVGQGGIPEDGLKNQMSALKEGGSFTDDRLEKAVMEIRDLLSRRGLFQAQVESQVQKDPASSQVDVSFLVRSARKYTVSSLTFTGETVLPVRELRAKMRTREGEVYVPMVLEQDLERIKDLYRELDYRLAEVEVVQRVFEEEEGSVNLVVEVHPQEKIEIAVEGAEVPVELLKPIWETRVFEEWGLAEGEAKIIQYLRKKGYLFAAVRSSIERDKNRMRVIHKVSPGKRYRIKEIVFEGLRFFTPAQIKEALLIPQGLPLFRRVDGGRLFELPREIEYLYATRGFPEAKVSLDFIREGNRLKPVFFVEEGRQERIETVSVEGAELAEEETLLSQISSVSGGSFYQPNVQKDIEKLEDFYLNMGVRGTEVRARVEPRGENLYRVVFQVDEGDRVKVENIIIAGNKVTRKSTIRREVAVKEGDFARYDAIRETKRNLERLGIFTEIKIEEIPLGEGRENLLIRVREGDRNYAGLGLGLETRESLQTFSVWNNVIRPRGTAEYIRNNVLGWAAQVSLVGQISFREKRAVLSWEQPHFFGVPVEMYMNAWLEREARKSYTYDRRGVSLTAIKPLTREKEMVLISTMRFARTTIVELSVSESEIDRRFFPFSTTSISGSYIWEKRDDPFNPTRGFFFSSALEWAYPYFKAESDFLKVFSKFQYFAPLFPGVRLNSTVRVGLGKGRIPIHERFFGGGSNSFRGVTFDELGPKDSQSGQPVGGKALVLLNFELIFPLIPAFKDLYGSVFYDKGNIFSKRSQVSLKELRDALGLGLRYKTPLGPVRLEIGWNLDPAPGERRILGFITIGNVF